MFVYVVFYKDGRLISFAKSEEEAAYIVAKFGGYTICDWRAFNKEEHEARFGTSWEQICKRVSDWEVWDIIAGGRLYGLPPM